MNVGMSADGMTAVGVSSNGGSAARSCARVREGVVTSGSVEVDGVDNSADLLVELLLDVSTYLKLCEIPFGVAAAC